jgi:hypothetical protein
MAPFGKIHVMEYYNFSFRFFLSMKIPKPMPFKEKPTLCKPTKMK